MKRFTQHKDIPNLTPRKTRHWKLIIALLLIISTIIFIAGFYTTYKINSWFEKHKLVFNQPVKVSLLPPIQIQVRKPQVQKLILEYPEEIDTPIERYICDKWGVYECKTALAVSKAENGTRQPDRFNINTNGTIDVGIFQINSIHFTKEGCSLAEIVNAEKNVDCAYQIWKASSWGAWVAFNNNNYLAVNE